MLSPSPRRRDLGFYPTAGETETMKPGSDKILAKAVRALGRADLLLEGGAADRAAERAYHAIVYAARALLNENGTRSHSHDGVRRDIEALIPPAPDSLRLALARSGQWRASGETLQPADADALVAIARPAVEDVRKCIEEES